jgi:Tfp pilus assembly protein PilV
MRRPRGFLLLETTLAAGVLAIGVSALLLLQLDSRHRAYETERRARLSLLAASVAEAWLAGEAGAARLAAAQREGAAIAGRDAGVRLHICRLDRDGACQPDGAGPYAVEIDWRDRGERRRLSLMLAPS